MGGRLPAPEKHRVAEKPAGSRRDKERFRPDTEGIEKTGERQYHKDDRLYRQTEEYKPDGGEIELQNGGGIRLGAAEAPGKRAGWVGNPPGDAPVHCGLAKVQR